MFCDLVGSTALAGRLDPEDLQQLVRRYHAAVGEAVAPYAGHIAQFLGHGVLVYFGYPHAHEDDAARAVRAALDVVGAVARLGGDIPLQTRIGIATGAVVVGQIGAGTPAAEQSATGGHR
jgi:class 3 adenylate cyclase